MIKKIFVFIMILGLVFLGVPQFTKIVKAEETNDIVVNLASPDLIGKEYLGNGVYKFYNNNGITIDYNVYNGVYTLNKNSSFSGFINIANINSNLGSITLQGWVINGVGQSDIDIMVRVPNTPYVVIGNVRDYDTISKTLTTESLISIYLDVNDTFNDFQFKFQLEKGDTATSYQTPIEAFKKHVQLEKDKSYDETYDEAYDEGFDLGFDYGYIEGFNVGLDEAFNENNLIPIALRRNKGTTGPGLEFVGFEIPINKKVKNITLLNLVGYDLKALDWSTGGVSQGLMISYENEATGQYIWFKDYYNEYQNIMEFNLNKDEVVENITIILALYHDQVPGNDIDIMFNHMYNNLGFYINNKILNDDVIDRFKEIIEKDLRDVLRDELEVEYENKLELGFQHYLQQGYDEGFYYGRIEGLNENVETGGFGMLLGSAFVAVGSLLSIELLPNITIGALVAIPVVFGVVMFIIGRRKE